MGTAKIRNMEEFSAASGISRPTVSKYFNDPGSVRKSTREKIERAVAEFDYRPNRFAMNLNRRTPKNIGIIVPYLVDPFFAEVVRQIELRCTQAGYWAVVLSSHGQSSLEANALDTLRSLKIAGAILAPLGEASDAHRIEQLSGEVPVVFLDSRTSDRIPFAGTDNAQSVSLMVDYLCRSGEPPCFLEMPRVNQNAAERKDAYLATMKRLGFEPAILTVGAGHDDHPLSRFTCPSLTTVAQDYQGLAARSLEMLLQLIDATQDSSAAPEHSLLEARLMMRASA